MTRILKIIQAHALALTLLAGLAIALPLGAPSALAQSCTNDPDCNDGAFCNGVERCVEGACVRGAPPCESIGRCVEAETRCLRESEICPDNDGDGQGSVSCGGLDCDDTDPNNFPGNRETCDPWFSDQDCDPSTFGVKDSDGDGHPDMTCG